jgi:response regulator RpfG family c-di-GMP phosphodiesterase
MNSTNTALIDKGSYEQMPWRLLVVDDEQDLHNVTRLVLRRMKFQDRSLEIISANSADEARSILDGQRDFAVALVDVVMETDQAGLDLVKDIRGRFNMPLTRIILRTGNPGMAPKREIIEHFLIDDYKDKTELTADRLYTSVFTALRAYSSLLTLDRTAAGLELIISGTDSVRWSDKPEANFREIARVIFSLLEDSTDCLIFKNDGSYSGNVNSFHVIYGSGSFAAAGGKPLGDVVSEDVARSISNMNSAKTLQISDQAALISFNFLPTGLFSIWIPFRSPPEAHALRLISLYVDKLQLNFENARLHHEILDAQRIALSKLCEAVEMRSKETGQHIYRMAKYSGLLASLAGMPENQVELLEAAAPLHDIGKVAIPDSILKKPGSLDADELMVMQGHAQNGWDLLHGTGSEMLELGAEIARTHHERWDGSGYPRGLKGDQIPLFGRIVSLADVFDALMSKRVYKEAFSFDKTISIIQGGAGKHFDPDLVALMVKNGPLFKDIFDQYPDPE